jgi:sugar lactone lactonase YvrE
MRVALRPALALTALTALAALGATAPALAETSLPDWRARFVEIANGCRAAGPAPCRDSLAALRRILPGHPGVLLAYARAANRSGERAAAMQALTTYAAMGLAYDLDADTTFAALRELPAYPAAAQQLRDNARPIAVATAVHRFGDAGHLVEDVVWDAAKQRWLVSTIRTRTILAVDEKGKETVFAAPSKEQPWGVFGLALDAKRKLLWAGTAATAEAEGAPAADRGQTALVAYDLGSGKIVHRVTLPPDSTENVFGDLTVARDGTVYVTDSIGGGLYRLAPGATALEPMLAARAFFSPQAPALSADEKVLFVADYGRGIARVDLAARAVTWLEQPDDLATAGTDGLYTWNGALVAVQNGVTPHRISLLGLSPALDRILVTRVIERASPGMGEPNHGAIVGDTFTFIGNSGWERMEPDGTMRTEGATPALLLRLPLR